MPIRSHGQPPHRAERFPGCFACCILTVVSRAAYPSLGAVPGDER
ncbi:hypothetical protein trd_A0937 (plasmid) [Thermomicrobium roseum DSM 5159]|uniref:Uncharacterized protein n=1 Tax=Thermomicrobium roseum (strain ATCC 27502 / DSM 5159 / P-2) TaxID=309801 RepID=B9L573_THERP|nr:hypothetical protein trd_A0937 [Thermomicrobium roseum DSM 5159]